MLNAVDWKRSVTGRFLLGLMFIVTGWNAQKVCGQNRLTKVLDGSGYQYLQIDAGNCFRVHLKTHRSNELKAEIRAEGEYAQDVLLSLSEEGKNLQLEVVHGLGGALHNDKLSAHKVQAVELFVTLPEGKWVQLYGESTNIQVSGIFGRLTVSNLSEPIVLDGVRSEGEVRSQRGNIELRKPGCGWIATSDYGSVSGRSRLLKNGCELKLKTVEGDIIIREDLK